MGSACCVAARDKTIRNGSNRGDIQRNIRYSPSWSFRRDNRRRVETSINWFSDDFGTNYRLENKSQSNTEIAYASEDGSQLESFSNLSWQKSAPSEGYAVTQLDQSVSQITPEGSTESQLASERSPMMTSSFTRSVSLVSPSPLSSSQPQFLSTSSRWSNGSTRGSHVGSSDGWFVPNFNELITTSHSHRTTLSFDNESVNINRDRITNKTLSSPSNNMQTCGLCSTLLTERPSYGTYKFIPANEVAVVAILICGHVYHSECLESITSETNKYDPACPVCTFGEKKIMKISEKAIRSDLELKARINKKLKNRVVDGDDIMFDFHKISSSKMSSSMKSSLGKHFLKRHFSFGSNESRLSENPFFSRKKRLFWTKSSKE